MIIAMLISSFIINVLDMIYFFTINYEITLPYITYNVIVIIKNNGVNHKKIVISKIFI